MVAVVVVRHLMQVRPVQLPVRGQVVPGVGIGGTTGIDVRQLEQLLPVGTGERPLLVRDRRLVGDRDVAGADALLQKIGACRVDGELEVPIATAIVRSRFERGNDLVDGAQSHLAADLAPRRQPEANRDDWSEQPVAADGEPEERRILVA